VGNRRRKERAARKAAEVARTASTVAARTTQLERDEERRAAQPEWPPAKALLIINTTSGRKDDSISHLVEVVDQLAGHNIAVDVRVKLRRKQARREARRAARRGSPLVIAAGGDGTVESIAAGLAGSRTVLGIVPLGTYNNVAQSLGVPEGMAAACALIARGATRAIDVGMVRAHGRKRHRLFMEMASVGLTAAVMRAGRGARRGEWRTARQLLLRAMRMTITPTQIELDGRRPAHRATTLLVEIANGPRMGPGIFATPDARMDDGLLNVAIYHHVGQAALAARFVALKAGHSGEDDRIERLQAQRVRITSKTPLPVVADSKVVGSTPATIEVLPGAVLAIVGQGPGLTRPVPEALVNPAVQEARGHIIPAAAAAGGAAMLPLMRALGRRFRRAA
jgi:diacylglycerol kinase (ATP)